MIIRAINENNNIISRELFKQDAGADGPTFIPETKIFHPENGGSGVPLSASYYSFGAIEASNAPLLSIYSTGDSIFIKASDGSSTIIGASQTSSCIGYLTQSDADDLYSDLFHNHSDIYYTQTQANSLLASKSDINHVHPVGGVSAHSGLGGLDEDDHIQYHTDARGDVRYLQSSGGSTTGLFSFGSLTINAPLQSEELFVNGSIQYKFVSDTDYFFIRNNVGTSVFSLSNDTFYVRGVSSVFGGNSAHTGSVLTSTGNFWVTGDIELTGTVDDRDIATDGTKLDGIEAGAVADHGALTGLTDDDHSHYHTDARGDTRYLKLTGGDVSGSVRFVQTNEEVEEGFQILTSGDTGYSQFSHYKDNGGFIWGRIVLRNTNTGENTTVIDPHNGSIMNTLHIGGAGYASTALEVNGTATIDYIDILNDGHGSNIDADLLDGQHGAYYSPITHNHDLTYEPLFSKNTGFNLNLGTIIGTVSEGDHTHTDLHTHSNKLVLDATTASFLVADEAKLDGIATGATVDQTASEILTAIKTVDGTGSGLDADLLDGQHAITFLRNDIATQTIKPLTGSAELFLKDANSDLGVRILGSSDGGYISLGEVSSASSTRVILRGYGYSCFNGGNVGIGTYSPDALLDVNGGGSSPEVLIGSNGGNLNATIRLIEFREAYTNLGGFIKYDGVTNLLKIGGTGIDESDDDAFTIERDSLEIEIQSEITYANVPTWLQLGSTSVYYTKRNGIVFLRGVSTSAVSEILPTGFRPQNSATKYYPISNGSTNSFASINASHYIAGSSGYDFSGITFIAES